MLTEMKEELENERKNTAHSTWMAYALVFIIHIWCHNTSRNRTGKFVKNLKFIALNIRMHTAWQYLWIKLHVRQYIYIQYCFGWHIWFWRVFEEAHLLSMHIQIYVSDSLWNASVNGRIRIKYLISVRLFVWQIPPKLNATTYHLKVVSLKIFIHPMENAILWKATPKKLNDGSQSE